MKVSASILSSECNGTELLKKFNNTNVDYIHLDVMDGKFVIPKTWTVSEIKKLNDITKKEFDVHLMVKNPVKYINDISLLNINSISFHYEAVKNIDDVIDLIKNYGFKVGLAINPKTEIELLTPYLEKIDFVNVMGVEPGYSGQEFIKETIDKIKKLKNIINNTSKNVLIEVDGGINSENAELLKEVGADILVSASFIQKDNMVININYLREL